MTSAAMFQDGLYNVMTGAGNAARDKTAGARIVFEPLTDPDLDAMYSAEGLAKRIVDLPVRYTVSGWRVWSAAPDEVSKINASEKRLGIKRKVRQAMIRARKSGGCALYLAVGDTDLMEPLDPARIGQGGLRNVVLLDKSDITPGQLEEDTASDEFGNLRFYQMGTENVHPSRVVPFLGTEYLNRIDQQGKWPQSALQSVQSDIVRYVSMMHTTQALMAEAKIDVVKIPGLSQHMASSPTAEAEITKRMLAMHIGKHAMATLVIDGDEDFQQKNVSFGSIPDVLDRAAVSVCASSGLPMSLLFGRSAGGLNSNGDNDIRQFYDLIEDMQEAATDAMTILDRCLVVDALGSEPEDLFYNWAPLHTPTPEVMATIAEKVTQAYERVGNMGVMDPESLGQAMANTVSELGVLPGFEAAWNDGGEADDDDGVEEDDD